MSDIKTINVTWWEAEAGRFALKKALERMPLEDFPDGRPLVESLLRKITKPWFPNEGKEEIANT